MLREDLIIQELHRIREQIFEESKAQGLTLSEFINKGQIHCGKPSRLTPVLSEIKFPSLQKT